MRDRGLPADCASGCRALLLPNEGAFRLYDPTGTTTGLKGRQDLVAATPGAGHAIVHPAQVKSNLDGSRDFLGWGTAKGTGLDNCADYLGSGWQVFVDGISFGNYFCSSPWATLSATAQDQDFQIQYGTCPFYPYNQRWVFYWEGVAETCRSADFSASKWVSAGSESIQTLNDEELDVHWEAMKHFTSGAWSNWGAGSNCADSPYRVRVISNTSFWTELP